VERRTANVLVVEDEAAASRTCQDILVKAGFSATSTTSQALPSIDLKGYDVILIDLDQTGPKGLALMDEIKERQPRIEVIGMAAEQDLEEAKEAVKYGASDFVAKPLTPATITSVVAQALERTEWTIHLTHTPFANSNLSPCWVEYEGEQQVTVGLERHFLKTIGTAIYIELPVEGQAIERDGVLLRILTRDGQIHVLTSPVAGVVLRVNEALLWDVDEIRQAGWAVRLDLERRAS
jgi:DNA-binding response OmpR family regulator